MRLTSPAALATIPALMKLNSIEEIIQDIRAGRMVIMADDEARENEGDLIFAASAVR